MSKKPPLDIAVRLATEAMLKYAVDQFNRTPQDDKKEIYRWSTICDFLFGVINYGDQAHVAKDVSKHLDT